MVNLNASVLEEAEDDLFVLEEAEDDSFETVMWFVALSGDGLDCGVLQPVHTKAHDTIASGMMVECFMLVSGTVYGEINMKDDLYRKLHCPA